MPWVSTPVPWYASMLGLGLALRGRDVTFIWDDTRFPDAHLEVQNRSIGHVLDWVKRIVPVTRLSDQAEVALNPEDRRCHWPAHRPERHVGDEGSCDTNGRPVPCR